MNAYAYLIFSIVTLGSVNLLESHSKKVYSRVTCLILKNYLESNLTPSLQTPERLYYVHLTAPERGTLFSTKHP